MTTDVSPALLAAVRSRLPYVDVDRSDLEFNLSGWVEMIEAVLAAVRELPVDERMTLVGLATPDG